MIRDLNKIFELWKDKVGSKRTPNPKSAEHQYQLREILNDFNWDEEVITELLYNLSEAKGKVYLKGKSAPPGAEVQTGPRGGQYYIGDPDTGEPEKPSAKKPKPKKLTKTQQAERDRIDALKIDKKLNDAETPQEEGKVLDEIVENEHQEILGGN